jgi:hypothetical protein
LLACASLFALGCGKSTSHSSDVGNAAQGGSGGTAAIGGSGGSAAEIEPYFQPGTRLKPLVVAAGPGLDIIEHSIEGGWYDSELDFDCYFAPDEAGVERCFPAATMGALVYADASCTRPVFTVGSSACDRLRYQYVVLDDFGPACGDRGFLVGRELPATTPLFHVLGSTCESHLSPAPSHVYELEPVPSETFVGMRRVRRARASGLDAYVREGNDGSRQVIGYFDPERDAPCGDLGPDVTPPSKCIPPNAPWSGFFADAACELRTAEGQTGMCLETPTTIIDFRVDSNTCPPVQPFDLYEIADARATELHTGEPSGACSSTPFAPLKSWIQGAPIDLSTLPTLQTLLVGTGRVQGRFSGFGALPYLPDVRRGPLVDAESGVGCQPFAISDGTLRCIPTSFVPVAPSQIYYESSSCSGARVLLIFPTGPCPVDEPLPDGVLLLGDATECSDGPIVTEAVSVAGRSNANSLYYVASETGACESIDGPFTDTPILSLGDSLDPAVAFALVERTIRQ